MGPTGIGQSRNIGDLTHSEPAGARTRTKAAGLGAFAWAYYGYLLFVILFGAWVRISGSGAGCGKSWPKCQGEVVPLTHEVKTLIEYTHRLTSGLLAVLTGVLVVWVYRRVDSRRVRAAAFASLAFVGFEALIGAGIVLGGLVAHDSSLARAVIISLHLANTLCLAASAGLTAWWLNDAEHDASKGSSKQRVLMLGVLAAVMVVSMTGAVTALGDTLFPVTPTEGVGLLAHIKDNLSPSSHLLVRLRIVHPLAAVLLASGLLAVLYYFDDVWPKLTGLKRCAQGLVLVQVALGLLNIAFGAPTWLQLAHLLAAQLLWLVFVLLTAAILLPMGEAP